MLLVAPYFYFTGRKRFLPYFGIAMLYGFIWVLVANGEYHHNNGIPTIFGFNIFPAMWWGAGLFGMYALHSHFIEKFKIKNLWARLFLFSIPFILLLMTVETLAFHVWGIRNVAASAYPGLPICNCIHGARWVQAAYLLNGPLFYLITLWLEKRGLLGKKQSPRKVKQSKVADED